MKSVVSSAIVVLAPLLSGCAGCYEACASPPRYADSRLAYAPDYPQAPDPGVETAGPAADYPMVLGDPFTVDGVTYTPADTLNYDAVGYAIPGGAGAGVSGAHRTLPLPSYVEVTALDSGRTILVRLDRRGPMAGQGLVELSPMAWAELGLSEETASPVRMRRVNPPEPERAMLHMGEQAPLRMDTPPGLLAALNRKLGSQPGYMAHDGGRKIAPPPRAVSLPRTPAYRAAPAHSAPNPDEAAAAAADAVAQARAVSSSAHGSPSPRRDVVRAAASEHGSFVQVGAFSSRARAEAVARSVGGSVGAVGSLWRVRIGPLMSDASAAAALAKARRAGYADARILHVS